MYLKLLWLYLVPKWKLRLFLFLQLLLLIFPTLLLQYNRSHWQQCDIKNSTIQVNVNVSHSGAGFKSRLENDVESQQSHSQTISIPVVGSSRDISVESCCSFLSRDEVW